MVIRILKRISAYTLDEYKQQCIQQGKDFEKYKPFFYYWAIQTHENALFQFIELIGEKKIITVTGTVNIDGKHHKIKPRTLSVFDAFADMLPEDTQDYCILKSSENGQYYVMTQHDKGHNVFKFKL